MTSCSLSSDVLRHRVVSTRWPCVIVGLVGVLSGCCPEVTREWTVEGSVVDIETGMPIANAEVSVTIFFTIDGPGNRTLDTVETLEDGTFVASTEFVPSCIPVGFGFFGNELDDTSGAPQSVLVRITVEGVEVATYFHPYQHPELITEFDTLPDGSIRGRIELPPVEWEPPP